MATHQEITVYLFRRQDHVRWMRQDLLVRLVPFGVVTAAVQFVWHPRWLGVSAGLIPLQLAFGLAGGAVLFFAGAGVQRWLVRRRGTVNVPDGAESAMFEAGYYILNGPLEEGFFRGLLQGGLGVLISPVAGVLVATTAYVLYHRLGGWSWTDVGATALVGVPLALAFWLLPGSPSLLGVSLAHIGATCGFLGPGTYFLRRSGLLGKPG